MKNIFKLSLSPHLRPKKKKKIKQNIIGFDIIISDKL